jgi:hypothetical protein
MEVHKGLSLIIFPFFIPSFFFFVNFVAPKPTLTARVWQLAKAKLVADLSSPCASARFSHCARVADTLQFRPGKPDFPGVIAKYANH